MKTARVEQLEKKLLHYAGKAIADYRLIQHGDRVLVCLSGGKDSFVLLRILTLQQRRAKIRFTLSALTVHPGFPDFRTEELNQWVAEQGVPYDVVPSTIYAILREKIPDKKNYCSFCARLRRGIIYRYAREHGFQKVALGHHRDDLIASLLMSILYSGEIRSMPPKLLTQTREQIVIRPLVYCQEADIRAYALARAFPIHSSLCEGKANGTRPRVRALIDSLAKDNPKVPSNVLYALQNVQLSQLMDKRVWDFDALDAMCH